MRTATLAYRKQDDDSQGCFSDFASDTGFRCVMVSLFRWNPGDHQVVWKWSEAHQRSLYHVLDVEGHTEIELHTGNLAGDKAQGFQTDSEGCGLPGTGVVKFFKGSTVGKNHDGTPRILTQDQMGVSASGVTLAALEKSFQAGELQEAFVLTVKDAGGSPGGC